MNKWLWHEQSGNNQAGGNLQYSFSVFYVQSNSERNSKSWTEWSPWNSSHFMDIFFQSSEWAVFKAFLNTISLNIVRLRFTWIVNRKMQFRFIGQKELSWICVRLCNLQFFRKLFHSIHADNIDLFMYFLIFSGSLQMRFVQHNLWNFPMCWKSRKDFEHTVSYRLNTWPSSTAHIKLLYPKVGKPAFKKSYSPWKR